MKSDTQITTVDAERIVEKLCNHWQHKFEIIPRDEFFDIAFPDATVTLHPTFEGIDITINAATEEQIATYERVVLEHLDRMAGETFSADWQHS